MQAEPIVALDNVTRIFLTDEVETRAISNISLSIHAGEYVAISGPSGCGKSTLLAILGLLDQPTEGRYFLAGRPVHALSRTERALARNRDVGFIFQSYNLIGSLSVRENVELPLVYRGLAPAERRRRAERALERVGLSHRLSHRPAQLSGGQQQRVAVARALAAEPAVLLADEPTGNLDSRSADAVMDLLTELHQGGAAIIMVTHELRFAERAQRTVRLLDGRIVTANEAAAASAAHVARPGISGSANAYAR
jgi:putative ABC transport system ATP-binding protein